MADRPTLPEHANDGRDKDLPLLIQRHLDWVYSVCRRSIRDAALADDVTQTVFMILMKKWPHLPQDVNMSGWLFNTARYCCRCALRDESTRRRHELAAAQMRSGSAATEVPMGDEDVLPMLDEQVARLGKADRTAVLLRYYERRTFREVGLAFGISEEAAKKRVQRAVEKLRARMVGKRIPMSADALTALLANKLVGPAPAKLTAAILAHCASGTTATAISASQSKVSTHVATKTLASAKTAVVTTGAVLASALVVAGIAVALAHHSHLKAPQKLIISRATTYITRPLDKDGLPNYRLALQRYLMKGITPTNNAAVPAIEIAIQGFRPFTGAKRFDYRPLGLNQLKVLNVAAPPEGMPRVHSIDSYFMHHPPQGYKLNGRGLAFGKSTSAWWRAEIVEQWFAQDFAWRPSRCLLLWGAIHQNRAVIKIIKRASRLPYLYFPDYKLSPGKLEEINRSGQGQIYPEVPCVDIIGHIGVEIANSATLELGLGHAHRCWRDIRTVFRLADLANQCPDSDNATAQYLESKSLYACRVLIEKLGSHPQLAVRANNWFRKRPPWPILTEHMLHFRRLKDISVLAACYRGSIRPSYHYAPVPRNYPQGFADMFSVFHPPTNLDWNWQFRQLNLTFDRLSNDARMPGAALEGTALWHWLHSYDRGGRKLTGNRLYQRQFIDSLEGGLSGDLLNGGVQRCSVLIKVGFALAAYHAAQGQYPKTLKALSPKFVLNPPTDPLNGKPLLYRGTAMGYTLALHGAWPAYTYIAHGTGPTQITVPAKPPTGWQKGPFP